MRILELFSGTHSVGKVAREMGWEVVSLDLQNADINIDIMDWDYKTSFNVKHFDVIHASPPCCKFSHYRYLCIGSKLKCLDNQIATRETLYQDMLDNGLPILRKTEEIIDYFNPTFYIIENPQTGRMKDFMMHRPHIDTDYCQWGFEYRKRTRFWTNIPGVENRLCDKKQCHAIVNNKHKTDMTLLSLNMRYRIPAPLIRYLLEKCV